MNRQSSNRVIAAICVSVVIGMVGMAYAAVPLYQLFCQVTGYAGTTKRAVAPADRIVDRSIVVRFDANVAARLGWEFKPAVRQVTVKLGETKEIAYLARNATPDDGVATATFNVTPDIAGAYFNKLECFCFTEQKLAAGEHIDMPVVFFVDPDLAQDPDLKHVHTITLSYTFFPKKIDRHPVAAIAGNKQKQGNL